MKNINNDRIKILIGYSKDDKTILFYEIDNRRDYFSICGCAGRLICGDDYSRDDVETYLDDADVIYDIMKRNNLRSIDDVVDAVIYEAGSEYRAICDCSCTDYEMYINNHVYNFETESCGQCCDEIKNFTLYNDKFNVLYDYWMRYHLKTAPDDVIDDINKLLNDPSVIKYIDDIYDVLEDTFFNEKE